MWRSLPAAVSPLGSVRGDPTKIQEGAAVSSNVPVTQATSDEALLPARVQQALASW